jgi:hypothetical protein
LARADYNWELGESDSGFPPIRVTYLIGWPNKPFGASAD